MQLEEVHYEIQDGDFLIYIDESGDESLSDPKYPIFILGGCAVMGAEYYSAIEHPWRTLKSQFFSGPEFPLHAAEVPLNNKNGIEAIGRFFQENTFHRFAVAVTKNTIIENSVTSAFQNAALAVVDILKRFPTTSQFDRVVFIVEASTRGEPQAIKHLNNLRVHSWSYDRVLEKQVEYYFMAKSLAHPGLEVADFVVHAAFGQTVSNLKDEMKSRKDFQAIFGNNLPCIHRFVQLKRIGLIAKED